MLTLRIAELRKKNNMTQQELGELLSVSDRTVSKWENGTVLPDVTMLPKLAARFSVSVDALLGLVPLADDYRPSDSGCREYWAHRVEYLKRTRRAMWNEDYLRFSCGKYGGWSTRWSCWTAVAAAGPWVCFCSDCCRREAVMSGLIFRRRCWRKPAGFSRSRDALRNLSVRTFGNGRASGSMTWFWGRPY